MAHQEEQDPRFKNYYIEQRLVTGVYGDDAVRIASGETKMITLSAINDTVVPLHLDEEGTIARVPSDRIFTAAQMLKFATTSEAHPEGIDYTTLDFGIAEPGTELAGALSETVDDMLTDPIFRSRMIKGMEAAVFGHIESYNRFYDIPCDNILESINKLPLHEIEERKTDLYAGLKSLIPKLDDAEPLYDIKPTRKLYEESINEPFSSYKKNLNPPIDHNAHKRYNTIIDDVNQKPLFSDRFSVSDPADDHITPSDDDIALWVSMRQQFQIDAVPGGSETPYEAALRRMRELREDAGIMDLFKPSSFDLDALPPKPVHTFKIEDPKHYIKSDETPKSLAEVLKDLDKTVEPKSDQDS